MAKLKIAVLVGSLRKDSFNRKLARAVEKLMPAEIGFDYIRIDHLPPYNQDFDENYPAECAQLKREIEAADALLFVTPEYNRSVPGVLKNAMDIASRPWGSNSFAGKPGAAIGISVGATGTGMAQQHLRNVLLYLDVTLMGQPEVYVQNKEGLLDNDGNIGNEGTQKFLRGFADKFVAWVKAHPRP